MEANNKSELFTDLSQEQSETVQGGHYYRHHRYSYYRPYSYYSYYEPRGYYYYRPYYYRSYGCGGW